jgi:hypothetical protein
VFEFGSVEVGVRLGNSPGTWTNRSSDNTLPNANSNTPKLKHPNTLFRYLRGLYEDSLFSFIPYFGLVSLLFFTWA